MNDTTQTAGPLYLRVKEHIRDQIRKGVWGATERVPSENELIESLGADRARPILKRFGFAAGYRDALSTREIFQWDNDAEWWREKRSLPSSYGSAFCILCSTYSSSVIFRVVS